jgi:hypothetical protein
VRLELGSWRKNVARVALIVGAVLAARMIVPELPRKNVLKLDLQSANFPVSRIDLEWTRDGEDAPGGGATLRFPEKAPKLVVFPLDLRTGDYSFQVVLHGDCSPQLGQSATTFRRHLRLEGGETTVTLYRHP